MSLRQVNFSSYTGSDFSAQYREMHRSSQERGAKLSMSQRQNSSNSDVNAHASRENMHMESKRNSVLSTDIDHGPSPLFHGGFGNGLESRLSPVKSMSRNINNFVSHFGSNSGLNTSGVKTKRHKKRRTAD